jgi:DNA primase
MNLTQLARKNLLKPYGSLDVLLYYALVAPKLKKFLRGKEIAAKNWIPNYRPLLKRGSDFKPLFIEDLIKAITPDFLELRKGHLDEARKGGKLSAKQELVWQYFVPRKLSDFFYATNNETPGKPIERIFFDLDKGEGIKQYQARQAALEFVRAIKDDGDFALKHDLCACWTGSSFHVFLLLKKPMPASEYAKTVQYSEKNPLATFTGKWAAAVQKQVKFKVAGGHEKKNGFIIFDPSQTPSGKLCRSPFSLHMKDAFTIDGVDVPLSEKDLQDPVLCKELSALTPEKVLKNLGKHASKFPARFK